MGAAGAASPVKQAVPVCCRVRKGSKPFLSMLRSLRWSPVSCQCSEGCGQQLGTNGTTSVSGSERCSPPRPSKGGLRKPVASLPLGGPPPVLADRGIENEGAGLSRVLIQA